MNTCNNSVVDCRWARTEQIVMIAFIVQSVRSQIRWKRSDSERMNHDHPIFIRIRTFSESRKLNTSSFSSLFFPSIVSNSQQLLLLPKHIATIQYLPCDILPFERYHAITLSGTTYKIDKVEEKE